MATDESPTEDRNDEVSVIAHRGFKGVYSENTVLAVREASKFDVEMIEVDVMPTKDDCVVAFHDERLSGCEGIER